MDLSGLPKSILKRVVVLQSYELAVGRLCLRFVPDEFRPEDENPVLRIEISGLADAGEAASKIAQLEQSVVDNIEADESALNVWPDHLELPVSFLGAVAWTHEAYALPDFVEAMDAEKMIRDSLNREVDQLKQSVSRALRFIDRTVDRIEKRRELTQSKDENDLKQIQLLRGVRRQLSED